MATKKKSYHYVLVMTGGGPVFVTSVDRTDRVAHWDKQEKPLEMGKYWAEDLALGLNLNGNLCYPVCSQWEIDRQPYRYNQGRLKWVEGVDEENASSN